MASTDLNELFARIERRLEGVSNHSVPALLHDVKTLAEQQDQSSAARADLALEAELEAFESEDERTRLIALGRIESLREQLDRTKAALRTALLQSKKRIDASGTAARAELFRSPNLPSPASPKPAGSKDDALMGATSDVESTLHRSLNLMRQELERSVLSTQMLEQQTTLMSSTSDSYTGFSGLLEASKSIITSMERADVIDRLVLGAAMLFFLLVCLYILKKRILDRGLRLTGASWAFNAAWSAIQSKRAPAVGVPTMAAAVTSSMASFASSVVSVIKPPIATHLYTDTAHPPLETAARIEVPPVETSLPVVEPTTAAAPEPTPTDVEKGHATIVDDEATPVPTVLEDVDPAPSTEPSLFDDLVPEPTVPEAPETPAEPTPTDAKAPQVTGMTEADVEADGFEDVPQEDLDDLLSALLGDNSAEGATEEAGKPVRDEL